MKNPPQRHQDTKKKPAELRQQEAERGRAAERLVLIGQATVAVGHELRQPLSVINNIAYCLRKAAPDSPHLDRLDHQVALASRIIANLMEFARSQTARRSAVDLNQLVEQQIASFRLPSNIRFRARLAPALPKALVDSFHVERALENLLVNAVQSMGGARGRVGVRTFLEPSRWGPRLVVEVADAGQGVPEQMRAHLFEPFRSGKSGGLGLGLALSRQLIEANEGTIRLIRTSRRGSLFQMHLPIAKHAARNPQLD